MPRNGSGTYTLPKPPFVPQTTISSADVNSDFSDIATAITASLAANGETPLTGPLKFQAGTAAAPSHTFSGDLTTGMYYPGTLQLGFGVGGEEAILFDLNNEGTGQDGDIFLYGNGANPCPVGRVNSFAGTSAPAGWFLLYGQAVSRTDYPELFTVISTTYGSGDGSTTFNLPDCRGRTEFGKDNMGGTAAGRITTAGSSIDGTTLGATGGAQTVAVTVAQANLPAVTLATTIAAGQGSHIHVVPNVAGSQVQSGSDLGGYRQNAGDISTNAATLPAMSGTTPLGGSGTAITVNKMPGAIIFNKIIFAGRA